MNFEFDFPSALIELPPDPTNIGGRVQIAPAVTDFSKRIRRANGLNLILGNGVDAGDFARMLAKIAYAYAVAELGIASFEPLVLGIIRGDDAHLMRSYIGSPVEVDGKGSGPEHEIGFVEIHDAYIVVRIRLFATLGPSAHYVVVGRKVPAKAGST